MIWPPVTVAWVLVPQSMAYAQLAGLPVVYGLYASFVPVIIASLWDSSSHLHTGPVAMPSLMVGVLRLAIGLLRLGVVGVVVNFLSSPVIVGFTNAAALM